MRGLSAVIALLILGGVAAGCVAATGLSAPALVPDAASVDVLAPTAAGRSSSR